MTHSMTGFSSTLGTHEGIDWSCEIRSVNNKGLDIRLRLPDAFQGFEVVLRKQITTHVKRGSLQVSFKLGKDSDDDAPQIDPEKLAWWFDQIATVQAQAEQQGVKLKSPTALDLLTARPNVMVQNKQHDLTGWGDALLAALDDTLTALTLMRAQEGAVLQSVLLDQVQQVETAVAEARSGLKNRRAAHAKTFEAAVQKLAVDVDPERLNQELAIFAVKSDVSEELDRLDAHIVAARALLTSKDPIGRKFEFLTQEFNREANTLCSKAGHIDLTRIGLELKSVIDQMREQVLNVE